MLKVYFKKASLFYFTIKNLKATQVYHRLLLGVKIKLYKANVIRLKKKKIITINATFSYLVPEVDFNPEYLKRVDIEDLFHDTFDFVGIKSVIDISKSWKGYDNPQLWLYNLHYFDYLYKLSYSYVHDKKSKKYYEKFKYLVNSWIINNRLPFGDGWHPYTISLRLTNWIENYQVFKNEMELDPEFHKLFIESTHMQFTFLRKNLEKDVLGNHFFENIKAIIIASIFFCEDEIKKNFTRLLVSQLEDQIMKDGMHFELSIMYHKIVLEGLIKITYWLKDDPIYDHLVSFISSMANVLYSFEEGFGKTPFFNDSANGVSKSKECLLSAIDRLFHVKPRFISFFKSSGYYVFKQNNYKVIFDCGDICPSFLPAHAHCDALSYELAINEQPIICNSGTYCYENNNWRDYFRSTKSHNTVVASDYEQSQCWGSFRVAKRIRRVTNKEIVLDNVKFSYGSHVTFMNVFHARLIGCVDDSSILVLDKVTTRLCRNIDSYIHLVPGVCITNNCNQITIELDKIKIRVIPINIEDIVIEKGWYSENFYQKVENSSIVFKNNRINGVFGYLLCIGDDKIHVSKSENWLKIYNDKRLIFYCDDLGGLLLK